MATTLKDIARLADVSITTVSLVLNDKAEQYGIAEATRENVRRLAYEHGYRANLAARALRLQKSAVIGVVVPDVGNPFFAQLVGALESKTSDSEYQIMVASTGDTVAGEADAVSTLLSRAIDGMILATATSEAAESPVPIVYVDRDIPGDHMVVTSDNYGGAKTAIGRLLEDGCETIAFVGGLDGISSSDLRRKAYDDALTEAGRNIDPALCSSGAYDRRSGYEGLRSILAAHGRLPDAVFATSYDLFEGVLDALREAYGEIPQGLRLATFDDHALIDFLPTRVMSIRQDPEQMAESTVALLFSAIDGTPAAERRHILPVSIIDRG